MNPITYMSTDAGAPVLTGQVDSYINLLKACLVDGYGSGPSAKAAAGWTVAFSDYPNHKFALRNDSVLGSGMYVRVLDDGSGTSATAAMAHMQAFTSMSDVNTGTDATPASITGWPGTRVEKSTAANSTAVPWCIIADNRTAYIALQTSASTTCVVYAFGDYKSYIPGFGYPFFIAGGKDQTVTTADRGCGLVVGKNSMAINPSNDNGIQLPRDYTSASGVVKRPFCCTGPASGTQLSGGQNAYPSPNALYGGGLQTVPWEFACAIGLMGKLRGANVVLTNVVSLANLTAISGPISGSNQILMKGQSSYGSASTFVGGILVEAGLPWD